MAKYLPIAVIEMREKMRELDALYAAMSEEERFELLKIERAEQIDRQHKNKS